MGRGDILSCNDYHTPPEPFAAQEVMPLAAAELAGKLEEAFTRPEFTSAVSDFANSHCHEFAVLETVADASAVEHPLR